MSVAVSRKLVILREESQIIVGNFFNLGIALLSLLAVTCSYWRDDRLELSLKEKIIAH